jgi:transcriptional regulator with XRE-family HTH domain
MAQRKMYQSGPGPLRWRNCIRPVRQARGVSQSELARRTGMAQSNLSAIETHTREPSIGVLLRIARALRCSLDDLVEDEGIGDVDRFSSFCGDQQVTFRPSSLRPGGV